MDRQIGAASMTWGVTLMLMAIAHATGARPEYEWWVLFGIGLNLFCSVIARMK